MAANAFIQYCALALPVFAVHAAAETHITHLQSTTRQTPLLELYSSEGCSSCPPADRWIGTLKQNDGLWRDVVPVVFHVDYWNYLGWRDIYSDAQFSARQQAYLSAGHISQMVTPGFIYAGQEWRGWRYHNALPSSAWPAVGELAVDYDGKTAMVRFAPVANKIPSAKNALRVSVGLLGFDVNNHIGAGENRGERLQHDFIVLNLQTAVAPPQTAVAPPSSPLASTGPLIYQWQIPLPLQTTIKHQGIAAWVSEVHDPLPLQAVGGYLAQ